MDMDNCLEPMRQLLVALCRDNGRPGQQHQRCRQRSEDIQQPVLSTGHVVSPRCTTPLQGLILLILASAPDPCRSSIRSRRCERGRLKRVQPAAEPAPRLQQQSPLHRVAPPLWQASDSEQLCGERDSAILPPSAIPTVSAAARCKLTATLKEPGSVEWLVAQSEGV